MQAKYEIEQEQATVFNGGGKNQSASLKLIQARLFSIKSRLYGEFGEQHKAIYQKLCEQGVTINSLSEIWLVDNFNQR